MTIAFKTATKAEFLKETIDNMAGVDIPIEMIHDYYLDSDKCTDIQDFIGGNSTRLTWSTNVGILDAAEFIIEEAIGNCNIEITQS